MERAIRGNVMNVSWRLAVSLLTALALIYVVATYLLSAAPFPELPPNEFISWTLEKALGVGVPCLRHPQIGRLDADRLGRVVDPAIADADFAVLLFSLLGRRVQGERRSK